MFVVMVAPECAPVAKVGGLADVVFGLSRELEIRGNDVEIILPKYACLRYEHIWGLGITYEHLMVPWYSGFVDCTVYFGFVHGRKCFFIEPHSQDNFFERGQFYGYWDDDLRFTFFTKAALEFMLKSGKRPAVIHTHDWQTGILPVLLYEIYRHCGMDRQRVVHTIHNFGHQGVVGERVLWATGLCRPEHYYSRDRLQDDFNPAALNLMKGAIVYSNFVTTVSPRHAWEARHTHQGFGLGHTLHVHQHKFGGVLNGLDYETWNPETDGSIARRYSRFDIDGKYENKAALRRRFMLRDKYCPIFSYVGRLDPQKGVPLILHSLLYAISNGAQFVLLGVSPQDSINMLFHGFKQHINDNPDCHIELGFNEDLARLIYAGSDMIVLPSMYEPCGMTQLIGLRYGTVPIARAVGGLADTVFDWDYSPMPRSERNGYVFDSPDNGALEFTMHRALGLWNHHPREFRELIENGMRQDYSWSRPGQSYLDIYDYVRDK